MLVDKARSRGWHVLLDAAAFVPTNRLDLRTLAPDFVVLSFYKMFGYPTGVGCLLARHDALKALRRPWFGGGTVDFATVQGRRHVLSGRRGGLRGRHARLPRDPRGRDRPAPPAAHRRRDDRSARGVPDGWLMERLLELRHAGGRPLVRLYGPADTVDRGGTVTLNPTIPKATCSTTGASRNSPPRSASRCAPAASAIRVPARRPKA